MRVPQNHIPADAIEPSDLAKCQVFSSREPGKGGEQHAWLPVGVPVRIVGAVVLRFFDGEKVTLSGVVTMTKAGTPASAGDVVLHRTAAEALAFQAHGADHHEYNRPFDRDLRALGGRLISSSNDGAGMVSFSPTDVWEFDDSSRLEVGYSQCNVLDGRKFYVVEKNYVGPNPCDDKNVDADTIEIHTEPARRNGDGSECIDGWCGTTNDWAVYGRGQFDTLEAARAEIAERFGDVRDRDPDGEPYQSDDEFLSDHKYVVEIYKPGKYTPMSRQSTADWAWPGIEADMTAETTDERIAELVAEYEAEAHSQGYELDSDLAEMMTERRQELRDEREAGDE